MKIGAQRAEPRGLGVAGQRHHRVGGERAQRRQRLAGALAETMGHILGEGEHPAFGGVGAEAEAVGRGRGDDDRDRGIEQDRARLERSSRRRRARSPGSGTDCDGDGRGSSSRGSRNARRSSRCGRSRTPDRPADRRRGETAAGRSCGPCPESSPNRAEIAEISGAYPASQRGGFPQRPSAAPCLRGANDKAPPFGGALQNRSLRRQRFSSC